MSGETLRKIPGVALKFLGLVFGYLVALTIVTFIWTMFVGLEFATHHLSVGLGFLQVASGSLFLVALARFYRKRKLSFKEAAGLVRTDLTPTQYAMFAGLGVAANLFFVILLNLLPGFVTAGYRVSIEALTSRGMLMNALSVLIYAPIAEEIIFRGICLKYLRDVMKPYHAAAVLSVVFGLLHMPPIWILYTMLMGFAFSVIAIREGSIIPAIVTHSAFNASSLALYLAATRSGLDWPFGLPLPVILLILALAGAAAAVLGIKLYKLTGRNLAHGS